MTDLFKCKKSGTTCCAPKSRIHEVQGMLMHRNDSFPVFVNPQQPIPPYNYPPNYQPLPPNSYAPIPNTYQPIPPHSPHSPLVSNYPVQPQNNYIAPSTQNNYIAPPPPAPPQPIPQTPIITNNYQPQPPLQNYPNNIYSPNAILSNPNINLAPAYSTPGPGKQTKILNCLKFRFYILFSFVCFHF